MALSSLSSSALRDPREAALSGAQAKMVIHLGVACVLGEQAAHPLDLVARFAQVGLHEGVRMVAQERARSLEHLARTARRKARKHGVAKRARVTKFI